MCTHVNALFDNCIFGCFFFPALLGRNFVLKIIIRFVPICSKIRNLQKQINQEGLQVPNQVNETMRQRQPPPNNANTMAEGITSKEKLRRENQFLEQCQRISLY
ncbi:Hypothetical_protein [Hexamita inflata]|uniref:Hypothetical_protein n=1 Tax=Hexamita inflata TaxID=28002 RepID=A0AA86PZ82_9EUKA|nr:Hypothetical protein HINF_LOCUS36800 [Hexamita inflata]